MQPAAEANCRIRTSEKERFVLAGTIASNWHEIPAQQTKMNDARNRIMEYAGAATDVRSVCENLDGWHKADP